MSEFSRRLYLSRRDLNMNQDTLAAAAGISRPYVSRLERGHIRDVPIEIVASLAAALGVRPEYLAGWSDDATGEDRPASLAEGRIVYQVDSPTEYRLAQELLDLIHELSPDNRALLVRIAQQLRLSDHVRVVE